MKCRHPGMFAWALDHQRPLLVRPIAYRLRPLLQGPARPSCLPACLPAFLPACLPALAALLLSACAAPTPLQTAPPPVAQVAAPPPQWQAPLPHAGDAAALLDWWSRVDDPALPVLIAQAQASHPGLEQALARIAQARAARRAAAAALSPSLGVGGQVNRAAQLNPDIVVGTQASVGMDAGWEIDLFGANRAAVRAQEARLTAVRLGWHEARVSLAAEVAQTLVALRACEASVDLLSESAASQARSAGLSAARVKVGMDAPANLALAEAAAADGAARVVAQQAECDAAVKALVMLTGFEEPALRQRLAERRGRIPQPAGLVVQSLPAQALAQRPDLAAAEHDLAAATADLDSAQAQRLPRLRLGGSIALAALRVAGHTFSGITYGFGPSFSWPLLDGDRLAAAEEGAQAGLAASRAAYALRLRGAVREVEEALLRLDAAQRRQADVQKAAEGFQRYLAATEQRWKVGTASQFELEDARRSALAAQSGVIALQREAVAAWISLYKALGGGWQPGAGEPDDAPAGAQPPAPPRATAARGG